MRAQFLMCRYLTVGCVPEFVGLDNEEKASCPATSCARWGARVITPSSGTTLGRTPIISDEVTTVVRERYLEPPELVEAFGDAETGPRP